jgi:RHS repeat-associated protein
LLKFEYDSKGRRIHKQVWNSSGGSPVTDLKFAYDGWNLIAELNTISTPTLLRSYIWGLDLSGSPQGAGGVGGLLEVAYYGSQTTNTFPAFDGNGNVAALVNAADGNPVAQYEFGPFGEVLRATGLMARSNPLRFSTKYQDDETDLLYYGFRYYDPRTGWWDSRDRAEEGGGLNIYAFVRNSPISCSDGVGLWATPVHHEIVDLWLPSDPYDHYPWRCCRVPVRELLKEGSDVVDGELGYMICDVVYWNFWLAQSSARAYQHAMTSPNLTPAASQALYDQFMTSRIISAKAFAAEARKRRNTDCAFIYAAIVALGEAYHAYSDGLSPAHAGFQVWYGPLDGIAHFGSILSYWDYVQEHKGMETPEKFHAMEAAVIASVRSQFQSILDSILEQ